jgi:hypothetical protein
MCSVDLSTDTNSGTTQIKMILTFPPGNGKYFIGDALNSSENVTQLINILPFFTVNIFYKLSEKKPSYQFLLF